MRPTPGGPTCCATAAPAASPAGSTSTGRPTTRSCCRSSAVRSTRSLAAGELERDGDAFRYFSHRLPAVDGGLESQHWRLAWWRSAGDRINWRRFFDINELVCLRMEEPEAFEAVHALPLRLHAEGIVDGLRIDHVDGLDDPAAYCRALRARLKPGAWLVVEKILLAGESLPADWGCDGTTGYDFMDEVNALQHDAAGERVLAEAWSALSGRPADFAAEEEPARREILARSFGAQLDACAAAFAGGELSTPLLRRVLGELLAHFPVYRTYGRDGVLSAADRAVLDRAAAGARRTCLATDRWAIDPVLRRFAERDRARAVARFQQLSAPIAAKAVEDTGFYRYGRLLSRNDVGFDPATFALDADAFHRRMQVRRADWPRALLATATHDHKRGEDVRARLAVLSGMAAGMGGPAAGLGRGQPAARAPVDGAPGPGDVALLLQTIVGAWPFDLEAGDPAGRRAFAERLVAWQQKALREAKLASDWAAIDEAYEAAARDFTVALVADAALPDLLHRIAALVQRIAPAGALNGLAQCLLRMTVPGVPDLYQGAELWDLSLVDPDNRRPVDWPRRLAGPPAGPLVELAAHWRDGRIKQALIARGSQAAAAPLAAVRGRRLSAGQARGAAGRCHDRLRPPAAGSVGAGGGAAAGAAPAPGAGRRAPCARWLARHRSCARRRSRRRHERSRRRAARGRRRSHVARRPVWNAAPGARLGRHDDARQGAALSLIGRRSSCAFNTARGRPEQPFSFRFRVLADRQEIFRAISKGHANATEPRPGSDNGSGLWFGEGHMPIVWGVNHAARLVSAKATGELGRTDIEDYLDGLVAAATLSYRKVLDMAE